METKLKSCPFCGQMPEYRRWRGVRNKRYHHVVCRPCSFTSGDFDTKEEALAERDRDVEKYRNRRAGEAK